MSNTFIILIIAMASVLVNLGVLCMMLHERKQPPKYIALEIEDKL